MFRGTVPGMSNTAILRVTGGRGPVSGPTHLAFPAAPALWLPPRASRCSSHMSCFLLPLDFPLALPLVTDPLLQEVSRVFSLWLCCLSVWLLLYPASHCQLIRGRLFLRRLEDQGLPCSSCDHSTSRLAHSRCAVVLPHRHDEQTPGAS